MRRKMPEHELPTYAAANFRTLQFILTRAPKGKDFPREWYAEPALPPRRPPSPSRSRALHRIYRPQSIDLLFRHFYRGKL